MQEETQIHVRLFQFQFSCKGQKTTEDQNEVTNLLNLLLEEDSREGWLQKICLDVADVHVKYPDLNQLTEKQSLQLSHIVQAVWTFYLELHPEDLAKNEMVIDLAELADRYGVDARSLCKSVGFFPLEMNGLPMEFSLDDPNLPPEIRQLIEQSKAHFGDVSEAKVAMAEFSPNGEIRILSEDDFSEEEIENMQQMAKDLENGNLKAVKADTKIFPANKNVH